MSEGKDNVQKVKAEKPSPDELFYLEWAKETYKSNLSVVNDVLKQLISLDTALLAVLIAFVDNVDIPKWARVTTYGLLLFSLITALIGIIPTTSKLDIRRPDMVKTHKERVLGDRLKFLWVACLSLVLAFAMIFVLFLFS